MGRLYIDRSLSPKAPRQSSFLGAILGIAAAAYMKLLRSSSFGLPLSVSWLRPIPPFLTEEKADPNGMTT